jgi:hypothetical protein
LDFFLEVVEEEESLEDDPEDVEEVKAVVEDAVA